MNDLRFERIAQIIAVAAVGSKDESISKYFIKSGAMQIRFSEYVKSQIHLNVVHGLYGRSLKEYVEALWFLRGRSSCSSSAQQVLRYYYSDLADFLINNDSDIVLHVTVDSENFELERISCEIAELRAELTSSYEDVLSGSLKMEHWRYAEIFDYAKDANDLIQKSTSYALALVLKAHSSAENLKIIESR